MNPHKRCYYVEKNDLGDLIIKWDLYKNIKPPSGGPFRKPYHDSVLDIFNHYGKLYTQEGISKPAFLVQWATDAGCDGIIEFVTKMEELFRYTLKNNPEYLV